TTAAASRMCERLQRWKAATKALGGIVIDCADWSLTELWEYVDQLNPAAKQWEESLSSLASYLAPREGDIERVLDDLRQLELLRAWIAAEDGVPERRQAEYGPQWQGVEATDWPAILA